MICHGMNAMDRIKENEMERSMEQRSVAITREVEMIIEKALVAGDQKVSQKEFDYCSKNRTVLKIPPDKFNWFAMKIQAQSEAIEEERSIDRELNIAGPFLSHNKIGIVWKSITDLQGRLYRIAPDLPIKDRDAYAAKINFLINTVNHKEDSLVAFCRSVLKTKGKTPHLTIWNMYSGLAAFPKQRSARPTPRYCIQTVRIKTAVMPL